MAQASTLVGKVEALSRELEAIQAEQQAIRARLERVEGKWDGAMDEVKSQQLLMRRQIALQQHQLAALYGVNTRPPSPSLDFGKVRKSPP